MNGTAGVGVFGHNVNHMPGSLRICFGYCFPQPSLVGVVLEHMSKCEARAVIVVPNTQASWFPMTEEGGVPSVQIASEGEDNQFFRVHHQRGAEPYTFGRGSIRAIEVDLRRNSLLYENNHAHHRDTQHPRTDKRAHIRTVRSVHTSRPLIAESVHAAHIDYGHHARPVHDNNAYACPAGPR